jgi:adenine phosphoribosyltransferase
MHDKRIELIRSKVRDVPDFPKPGIIFKDITPLLAHPEAFETCIDLFIERYRELGIDTVVGIESRGFIFGAALASRLRRPFVPARKPGKLPWQVHRAEYELEYGTDALEIHTDAFVKGANVLIVDDLLATGGTARAASELVQMMHGKVVGTAFAIELSFLKGAARLKPIETFSILKYEKG